MTSKKSAWTEPQFEFASVDLFRELSNYLPYCIHFNIFQRLQFKSTVQFLSCLCRRTKANPAVRCATWTLKRPQLQSKRSSCRAKLGERKLGQGETGCSMNLCRKQHITVYIYIYMHIICNIGIHTYYIYIPLMIFLKFSLF